MRHSAVISSSEREAAYVIDGLTPTDAIKSDGRSADTHGYSEAVFATAHLLDFEFAPRIKGPGRQRSKAVSPHRDNHRASLLPNINNVFRFRAPLIQPQERKVLSPRPLPPCHRLTIGADTAGKIRSQPGNLRRRQQDGLFGGAGRSPIIRKIGTGIAAGEQDSYQGSLV